MEYLNGRNEHCSLVQTESFALCVCSTTLRGDGDAQT